MPRSKISGLVTGLLIVLMMGYSPALAGQELIDAAGKGDLQKLKDLLKKGQNVNSRDENSWTVLMEASKAGHLDIVKALLAAKALVNARDKDGSTALMAASYPGHEEIVRLLLENGADIHPESRGATALGWASMKARDQVMALLKASGAKDLGSDYQNAALIDASATNDLKQVQELLDKGVDVNTKEIGAGTALIAACIGGHVDVVRLLLARGADVTIREDKYGTTPLMQASCCVGNQEIVKMLLAKGADVNAKDKNGATALIGASEDGHLDIVKLLLQAGADVNSKYKDGSTALMSAAVKDHADVVKVLLEKGANVNEKKNDGWTTLMSVAFEGHPDIIRLLLAKGADVNAKDSSGFTALTSAVAKNRPDVAKLLLDAGADVNTIDQEGSTPLIAAAITGHVEAVRLLLDRGARVNLKDNKGMTALAWAAFTGHTAVVEVLLAKAADINAKDSRGLTALMNASMKGRLEAAKLFIEKGADVNAKDSRGVTALYWASANGHSQVEKLLKAHGAQVKAEEHGTLLLTIQVKSDQPVTTVMAALRKRATALGASKGDVVQMDSKTVSVRLPGYKGEADKAVRIMEKQGLLEFKLVDKNADVAAAQRGDIPEGDELIYQEERNSRTGSVNRRPWVVKKQPLMTGEALSAARTQRDSMGRMIIAMDFNATGARQFARITKDHVGDKLAIILDNHVYSAPVIKMEITMGSAIIEGQFSPDESVELALALTCGPMATPVKVVKSEWLGSPSYKIETDEPSDLLLALRAKSDQPVTRVIDAIRNRAAALGASKDDVVQTDSKTVSVRLAGYQGEADKAARIMAKQGLLEFKLVDKRADVAAAERGDIPEGDELIYQEGRTSGTDTITRRPWVVMKQPLMTADVLSGVTVQPDHKGGMFIGMDFNAVGAREFERITSEHVNERLAIVVDNEVYSVPTIRDRVSEGKALIVGEFTPEEVEELALVLRFGPLDAPLEIVKSEWMKPSSANK